MVIISVAQEMRYTPEVIDRMYVDDIDHHGIMFWYNHFKEQRAELDKK